MLIALLRALITHYVVNIFKNACIIKIGATPRINDFCYISDSVDIILCQCFIYIPYDLS